MRAKLYIIICAFLTSCGGTGKVIDPSGVDEKTAQSLKAATKSIFNQSENLSVWDTEDCSFYTAGDEYYVICPKKGDKSVWTGEHDILLIFDKQFNFIEVN